MNPDRSTRAGKSKRLTVLSQAERLALYGLPDFDDFQRAEFFAFTKAERALAERRKGPVERLQCLLQMGYFKAKNAFFNLSAHEVPAEDVAFLIERYFPGSRVTLQPLTEYEQYAQRGEIAKLFGYRLWSGADRTALVETAALLAKRDVRRWCMDVPRVVIWADSDVGSRTVAFADVPAGGYGSQCHTNSTKRAATRSRRPETG